MSLKSLILIGAGGHGKSVLSVLQAMNINVTMILDDNPATWGKQILGVTVQGSTSELNPQTATPMILGLGNNMQRKIMAERFPQAEWVTVLHPSVYLNPSAKVGSGSVLFPGAVVGADVILGAHVIISSHCTVGHDAVFGDYAQAAPGVQVAGDVQVETGTLLAIGSIVCPEVRIGEWATLAAGGVAVKNLPPRCVAYGTPAKPRE